MTLATLRLPPGISPKVLEALEDLLECVASRYTGPYEVHFNDGVPQIRHRQDTKKFGTRHYRLGQEG